MPRSSTLESPTTNPPEPRWLAILATLLATSLYSALPDHMSIGPHWLLPGIVVFLLVPTILTTHRKPPTLNIILGHMLTGVITLFLFVSLARLIRALFAHLEPPGPILCSGALLWATNVLVFASWYWRLDAGGPHARASRLGHDDGAFLFPQMSMDDKPDATDKPADQLPWSPRFIDYLFLSFNTSTALSPTDTPVLSRWAKMLMMIQSLISLTVTLVLVGRAVNIM